MGSRVTSGSLSQQEKKKNNLAVDDETNLIWATCLLGYTMLIRDASLCNIMSDSGCKHLKLIQEHVMPSADGCEDCLKIGDSWVHLRLCLICGHVGCWTHQRINMRQSISVQQNIQLLSHL